ncbi:MAG: RNA polymerase sigma factor [Oscillospiraceae bacterium]|nr:RNA polymerase sigma factor [Oscillospiraceae bacterium]
MVEELYASHYDELLYYCGNLDRAAAEDLVQETYIRALTHLEDLQDLNRGQCRAWLYKTAKRIYIDRVRKLSREVCVEREQLDLEPFEEDLTQADVGQLVSRLPEGERALFTMRYFEGYNATELGELFSLPPSTVRARLASARKRLSGWYQELDEC